MLAGRRLPGRGPGQRVRLTYRLDRVAVLSDQWQLVSGVTQYRPPYPAPVSGRLTLG